MGRKKGNDRDRSVRMSPEILIADMRGCDISGDLYFRLYTLPDCFNFFFFFFFFFGPHLWHYGGFPVWGLNAS